MRRVRPFSRGQRGFTLIELAVVGATISVLMAIALPRVTTTFKRVRYAEARTTVSALENAMREHWGRLDRYPPSGGLNPPNATSFFPAEMDPTVAGWSALSYKPDGSYRYRYSWETDPSGKTVTITAIANTDNDESVGTLIRVISNGYREGEDTEVAD